MSQKLNAFLTPTNSSDTLWIYFQRPCTICSIIHIVQYSQQASSNPNMHLTWDCRLLQRRREDSRSLQVSLILPGIEKVFHVSLAFLFFLFYLFYMTLTGAKKWLYMNHSQIQSLLIPTISFPCFFIFLCKCIYFIKLESQYLFNIFNIELNNHYHYINF